MHNRSSSKRNLISYLKIDVSPEGLKNYTLEYNKLKSDAKALEDESGAKSPEIFSPLKFKHFRPTRHEENIRKLAIVDFESSDDSEDSD